MSRLVNSFIKRNLDLRCFCLQVKTVEFMESHLCRSSDVFQYLVLLQVQVTGKGRGKVAVLDAVDRFRAGNMSGYVTVYSDLTTRAQNTNIVMV